MQSFVRTSLTVLFVLAVMSCAHSTLSMAQTENAGWRSLQPGLKLRIFEPSLPTGTKGERLYVVIVKINPKDYDFHLLTASENGEGTKTLPQWMHDHDLHAAINAGMFWKDLRTSTGFMKNLSHINNSYFHPEYEGFLAFHPIHKSLPEIRIIDREHHKNWRQMLDLYGTVIQGFRMISVRGENVWEKNGKKHSVASIGITKQGKVLFMFSQTPVTIHDFNKVLLRLPLDIVNCMFLEGGATAGLMVEGKDFTQGWKGTAETFLWTDGPSSFVRLPNVIGITPTSKEKTCSDTQ
ncbi:MAG: phosphodiester glycosidase family protein [Thermodesulfobacteriota bacterium]